MTPGEPSSRGYGRDDRYPPSYPAHREDRAGRAPGYGAGAGYGADAGYGAGRDRFWDTGYDRSPDWRHTPPAREHPTRDHPAAYRPWDPAHEGHRYAWPGRDHSGWSDREPWSEDRPWPDRPDGRPDYQVGSYGLARDRQPRSAEAEPRRPRTPERTPAPTRRQRRKLPLWQELPLLLVIAFCLAVLIRTFLLQAFYIPSGSMEDTLIAGDRVLVNKLVYDFREPARGEVVVFQGPPSWAPEAAIDSDPGMFSRIGRAFGDLVGVSQPGEKDFIKRVIGVPGDVIYCCDEGRVVVNGVPLEEPYVVRDSPLSQGEGGGRDCRSREFDEVVVPPGELFVMGDHRQRSQDSRCQGMVPIENVIGRAFLIVWPNDRWAGLSATDAFADVPSPVAAGAQPVDPGAAGHVGLVLPLLLPLAVRRAGHRAGGRSDRWTLPARRWPAPPTVRVRPDRVRPARTASAPRSPHRRLSA